MAPRKPWIGLLAFVAVVTLVAVVSSWATIGAVRDYGALRGPAWAPPAWLFGPVWTVLYATIAGAGWLVWRGGARLRDKAMLVFWLQLGLNGIWSPLFFALGWRGLALVCILAMDAAIATTIVLFSRRRPAAAILLLPYLAWVLFATALNWAYWSLNR